MRVFSHLTYLLALAVLLSPGNVPGRTESFPVTKSTNAPASLQANATNQVAFSWKVSPLWTKSQEGPQDIYGHHWYEPMFDDSSWITATIPFRGEDSNDDDRYYRSTFNWDGVTDLGIEFGSDDGLAIYINGEPLGEWGSGWRIEGCVNDPYNDCAISTIVPPQQIPALMLLIGDNTIAIDIWNARVCCYYSLKFSLYEVSERFSISGHVVDMTNNPMQGVSIAIGGSSLEIFTDDSGAYAFTGLISGTYTLLPAKSGYSFTPELQPVNVPPDQNEVNFIGLQHTPTLSPTPTTLSPTPTPTPLPTMTQEGSPTKTPFGGATPTATRTPSGSSSLLKFLFIPLSIK